MTTILVTGANRGLGLEFVRQYAEHGDRLIACCRAPEKADKLAAVKGDIRIMAVDVGDQTSVAQLARALEREPIDILINNAGVYGPKKQSAEVCDYEGFLATLRINSLGPLMLSQALKANLMRGKDKKIAVLTSKMGSIGDSSGGDLAYRASKAALNMIMHVVAHDWARDGIAIAILHPGWVQTDMGGSSAPLVPVDSVRGLRAQIAALGPKTSGRFLDYRGTEIAW